MPRFDASLVYNTENKKLHLLPGDCLKFMAPTRYE